METRRPTVFTRLLCFVTAGFLVGTSFVSAEPHPSPAPSPLATFTPTPAPSEKCCLCVVPDKGERDHERFTEQCQACALNENENPKALGCSQKIIVEKSRLVRELVDLKQQAQCTRNIYVINNQHGPIFGYISDSIRLCVEIFPTCSLDIDDRSCQSFRDEDALNAFLEDMRTEFDPYATLTMCGNTGDNISAQCARSAASKLYILSTGIIDSPQLPCNPEGYVCSPAGDQWSCLDRNGKITKQTCCPGDARSGVRKDLGFWVNGESCKKVASCSNCKSPSVTCLSKQLLAVSLCVQLEGGGQICGEFKSRCTGGSQCMDGECRAMPSVPTDADSSVVPSPSPQQEQEAAVSGSISPVPGLFHHFKASGSTLELAFTERGFFGSSEVVPISGARGNTGVAVLSLDPASTLGRVGLRNGDIIHFVNNQKIGSEADIMNALAQSRRRTLITYSRQALTESKGKKRAFPMNPRWNWIITISRDDSLPGAPQKK